MENSTDTILLWAILRTVLISLTSPLDNNMKIEHLWTISRKF